jgi:hypothetical protein
MQRRHEAVLDGSCLLTSQNREVLKLSRGIFQAVAEDLSSCRGGFFKLSQRIFQAVTGEFSDYHGRSFKPWIPLFQLEKSVISRQGVVNGQILASKTQDCRRRHSFDPCESFEEWSGRPKSFGSKILRRLAGCNRVDAPPTGSSASFVTPYRPCAFFSSPTPSPETPV